MTFLNIGIKQDLPFINIRNVQRDVLKTKGKPRGFQHLARDLVNVNDKIMFDSYCENEENNRTLYSSALPLTCTLYLLAYAFYKYAWFGPWSGSED